MVQRSVLRPNDHHCIVWIYKLGDAEKMSRDGGIGIRAGLKIQWRKLHAGSIPAPGTRRRAQQWNTHGLRCLEKDTNTEVKV